MSTTFPGLVHDAEIRHDGSNSYRLMQLGCLESVANSTVAYSSSSPLTYSGTGTEFATPISRPTTNTLPYTTSPSTTSSNTATRRLTPTPTP
ncbi:hypothetical protein E2320_019761 [Naja naja]|nr:hypothetical protein E2320_019761 [Naja naja]